ncbi:hypothetical protein [Flavisolibacter nicotianae]|uniref:hypothetical protein n=1 Tax=Flavisolibacter nicotianae TaxID=2364882 RepID=UPI000EB41ED6|nr:hypothetical protein [Flavisolibacter nicotianae]
MTLFSMRMLAVLAATQLFLLACTSNDQNKPSSATTSDTAGKETSTTPATTTPTSTIVTSPQAMLIVRHKVKDFTAWKMAYDGHDSARMSSGLHNYVIGRGATDSSTVLVALKADDMAKAKAFAKSSGLKQAMQKGGVMGTPTVQFITMTFQDTARIGATLRSETTFKVKGWTAWEKSFKEGEQERIDNGIVVRAYGHDADDSNQVRLVTALTDTAKAYAYWKSDQLKKRRAASGVLTTPERFVFRIVQRY